VLFSSGRAFVRARLLTGFAGTPPSPPKVPPLRYRCGRDMGLLRFEGGYHVDAALFGGGVAFPPPATGSDIFAGFDGSGAGCAAE